MRKITNVWKRVFIVLSLFVIVLLITAATLDLTGNVKVVTTRWQDWTALGSKGYDDGNWSEDSGALYTTTDGAKVYFQIPYLPGTKLTRIRVGGAGDSQYCGFRIILKYYKADNSDQYMYTKYTSSYYYAEPGSGPIDVDWDITDFEIGTSDGETYLIEIETDITSGNILIWSYGVKTEHIIY